LPTTFVTAVTRSERADTATALPADMDAITTPEASVRAAGVTKDWLAGLETPEGIRGAPAAVIVAEDAPCGDGAHEVAGSAGQVLRAAGAPRGSNMRPQPRPA
jgi:hypothetical protein